MSSFVQKLLILLVIALFGAATVYLILHPELMSGALPVSKHSVTIAELAYSYYGDMSRPLFPETSLFLPLPVQLVISFVIVLVMALVALFFPKARRFVMLLTTVACLRHLLWRGFETLDVSTITAGIVSITIFVAEIMAFVAMLLSYFQVWGQTDRKSVGLARYSADQLPTVDIFICTYSEPVSVLYRSLVGALSIDYPKKRVYLLDDGNRQEMAQLAARLGANYIARSENIHAKAGNLNNAFKQTNGDLILIFDADHVAAKCFLQETVGFFMADSKMGFVQTPQHFFTEDPFQRNLLASRKINNEQDLFFHVIEPGNDYWGAAFFGGSGAIFRRQAINEAGGFAVETITEDVHTGMRIHAKGWKSLFYNRDLAAGLSQESFADFIKQRLRWAKGMTQIFVLENPLFKWGLSLPQKLCYLSGIWYFFHGLPRLIFLIAPLFFLLFGFKTINAGFVEVLMYYIPSFLCATLGYTIISKRMRHSFWSEVYEVAFCVYITLTSFTTFLSPGRAKFRVTPKGGVTDQLNFNWRIVFPQVMIAALTMVGIGMAIIRGLSTPEYAGGIYTNLFWSLYNLVLLFGAIYVAQERPQFRLAPRIFRRIRCELKLLDGSIAVGYTTNISESGLSVIFNEPVPIAGTVQIKIMDWELNETTIVTVQTVRSSLNEYNQHQVGFRIVNRTEEQHQKLVRHMFGSPDIWENDYVQQDTGASFWDLVTVPFRLSGVKEQALKRGAPRFHVTLSCMIQTESHQIMANSDDVSESGISLFFKKNEPVAIGQSILVHIQWPSGHVSQFPGQVMRLEDAGQGQYRAGVNFMGLTREQRVELIQQIYRPKEGLVRVAPSINKLFHCAVKGASGQPVTGMSQEVSEMGMVIVLDANAAHQAGLKSGDDVQVQIQWQAPSAQVQQTQQRVYPGKIMDIQQQGSQAMTLVYFQGLDMKTLDEISFHIYEAENDPAFHTRIS
ncbi:MAG: PilZ domain-containing protein [Vampirovibrionales bacterium]|nr:PilZ domain-containing protein [Vampirovibrionales bacterium]